MQELGITYTAKEREGLVAEAKAIREGTKHEGPSKLDEVLKKS